jgi:hypothetical protein
MHAMPIQRILRGSDHAHAKTFTQLENQRRAGARGVRLMQKTVRAAPGYVQIALEKEFARLKRLIPCDEVTAVSWKPQTRGNLSGEVLNGTIYVYDENPYDAIDTLKHEYVDCVLTRKIINPLIATINLLVQDKAREIYKEKERIVNNILKLSEAEPHE